MGSIAILLISLGIILIGAEIFTNGVEWLGKRLNLSEGAVGSILAAVGTALPETMIPVMALLFGGGVDAVDIGVGAILGAPLMLSTLAMFVTGMAVILFRRRRQHGAEVVADVTVMNRDLGFFLIVFTLALLTGILPNRNMQLFMAVGMLLSYVWYVIDTLREEREECEEDLRACYFAPRQETPGFFFIIAQLIVALGCIIGGAELFVEGIKDVAVLFGIPAFVLALVIAPIATELPEKFNSVIWISRGKDTLSLGNITGAMVFQSSVIPAIGIFLTDWHLGTGALLTGGLALVSAGILFIELKVRGRMNWATLLAGGIFYGIFIILVLNRVIS